MAKSKTWHHHMALVMMAMLFTLEERLLHHQTRPLLSGTDLRALLDHFLPRRDTTLAEVLRQMEPAIANAKAQPTPPTGGSSLTSRSDR